MDLHAMAQGAREAAWQLADTPVSLRNQTLLQTAALLEKKREGIFAANREDLLDSISCAPLPTMNEDDPYYSAEATHIPLVIWNNSEHKDICEAFIEYLFQDDNYVEFLSAVPVGMLPSISGISDLDAYASNETIVRFADEAATIADAVAAGHAIGFEHGPSVQAGLLTSQGVIENMFQDIVTNGTDVATAAQAAENQLNEIFETQVAG